jgi:hypothetical protein
VSVELKEEEKGKSRVMSFEPKEEEKGKVLNYELGVLS